MEIDPTTIYSIIIIFVAAISLAGGCVIGFMFGGIHGRGEMRQQIRQEETETRLAAIEKKLKIGKQEE